MSRSFFLWGLAQSKTLIGNLGTDGTYPVTLCKRLVNRKKNW